MLNDKDYPFALSVVTDWYAIPREHFPYETNTYRLIIV